MFEIITAYFWEVIFLLFQPIGCSVETYHAQSEVTYAACLIFEKKTDFFWLFTSNLGLFQQQLLQKYLFSIWVKGIYHCF